MSTPPFVALPQDVEKISLIGKYSDLAGLIAHNTDSDKGTVLLIPGFTGSKEDFIAVFTTFRELGYTVISYDQRGQFESPGPHSLNDYELTDFADDVIAVARQIPRRDGPLHVVGHSFGGLVARQAAISLGPRVKEHFSSLTLLSSGPASIPGDLRLVAANLTAMLPNTPLAEVWRLKEEIDDGDGRVAATDEVYEFLKHRFITNNPIALKAKANILIAAHDQSADLANVARVAALPLLVAFGDRDDRWTPTEQDGMARRLGARRYIWPGLGHSPAAESPQTTTLALAAFFDDYGVTHSRFATGPRGYLEGMEIRLPVPTDPSAVGGTRRSLTRLLRRAGLDSTVDDFQIVASELVTNAIRYGNGPIEVLLSIGARKVRLSVTDSNTHDLPVTAPPSETAGNGRGLHLVAALASDWGVDQAPDSKTVWAEIAV